MGKFVQIIINLIFYAFLLWLLYDATIISWDPWFAFVVAFVVVVAVIMQLMPSLHASKVSPGEFPYEH
jgi:Na+-translocating ferredoxin:NAD+ oxidoreductase RnfA subunit